MEKRKLGICCNFSHKHVGGSETVIKHISERLVKNYNYEVNVYSFSCNVSFRDGGVNYYPCLKGGRFISQIGHNDHLMVYSDSFWEYDTLVRNIDNIDCTVSVCLVGGYHMQSHPEIFDLLKNNIDKFNLITHSKTTPDYKWCIDNYLPVKVVPNGVDLEEFRNNSINFREKYNIKEKYIILNVSSFFYGKGQEILPKIAKRLSHVVPESRKKLLSRKFRDIDSGYKDFVILSISNTVKYPYDKVFLDRTRKQSNGLNIRFLRDLPREDVVAAFNASDLFAFTSRKEVSPLVILESKASKTPWVSFDVGDVKDRWGGVVVRNMINKDSRGYNIIDDNVVDRFSIHIAEMLDNKYRYNRKIEEGQQDIEKIDWDNIVPLYNEVFSE
jgi:glycosyltransferase involved in cell wall biosynthesis